jgi:hypothetical protein
MAGLAGGSLARATADSWRLSIGIDGVLVHAPRTGIRESSPDGLTVLVAASRGLVIYRRDQLN